MRDVDGSFGPEVIWCRAPSYRDGVRSVHVHTVGEASVFPATSVAPTLQVCAPTLGPL
jgi:hypothetical protein